MPLYQPLSKVKRQADRHTCDYPDTHYVHFGSYYHCPICNRWHVFQTGDFGAYWSYRPGWWARLVIWLRRMEEVS